MARFPKDAAIKQIQTLFTTGSLAGLTDRELLDRFLAGDGGDSAFEVLVERHGPVVRATCRSLLGDVHEADDAFQATFLVLARRAGSIRDKDALASWLYAVAARIALRTRTEATRRRSLAQYLTQRAEHERLTKAEPARDEMPELHEEIARLPERYRAPIVLCDLESQTHEQAARTLGCPVATLQTRLLRAKARLRTRLARRGLAPAAGLLAVGTAASQATAGVTGSLPISLAGSTARAAASFASTGGSGVEPTILMMTRHALRALLWTRLKLLAGLSAGLAAGLLLAVMVLFAADKKPGEPVMTIKGRITNSHGGPIAGAHVWLRGPYDGSEPSIAQATTNAQGDYTLAVPEAWSNTPIHRRGGVVWAHAAGHQLATANAAQALKGSTEPVNVKLPGETDTSFVVVGPDGRPVAGAVVEPHHLKTPRAYEIPPPSVLSAVRGTTDATGRATLPAIPREGFGAVQVTAQQFGIQRLRLKDSGTEPAQRTIRLRPTGSIAGRVTSSRPEWTRGVTIYLEASVGFAADDRGTDTVGDGKAVTQADGTFMIQAIAIGRLTFLATVDQALPVRPRLPETLDVQAGKTTQVEIPLENAVRASGVIRSKDTGDPIAGASISVGYGSGRQSDTVISDAMGHYSAFVLAGDVRMHVIGMPGPFIQLGVPWNERYRVPAGATTFELPAIDAVKGTPITGRLVDGDDRPIANVQVIGTSGNRRYAFGKTDAAGAFTTNPVPAGMELDYSVWRSDHEGPADATIVKENPLLLRMPTRRSTTKAGGVTASGVIIDSDGKPIEGAEVTILVETEGPGASGGGRTVKWERKPVTTDAKGRFQITDPLVKGSRYRAIVNPGPFAIAASGTLTSQDGSPLKFGTITANRLRAVAGRVLDTGGKPVVGATVLNWGSPAPLTSAVTGPSSRFHLASIPRENAFLFVEAPGYRFRRTALNPGKATIDIVIRRDDQPPELAVANLGSPISRPEALELAAKVIKPYSDRALGQPNDDRTLARVLEVLARIDPNEACRKCQAGESPWNRDSVRRAIAQHRATTSIDEARSIASTIKSDFWRMRSQIELADALPTDQRDARVQMLEDLARQASGMSNANLRGHISADVAKRLIDLDRRDHARALIDEVLKSVKIPEAFDGRMTAARETLGYLAQLDLKAALALNPERGGERTVNDLRGLIAQNIGDTNPAEAERLIGLMTWNKSETYAVKTCRRMAPADLPRARRIATALKSDVLRGYAFGLMAGAVAKTDRSAAKQLLTDSFDSLKKAAEHGMGGPWSSQSAATMAAALLPVVERVDPDHLAEAIERVQALRWFPRTFMDLSRTRPDTSTAESMRGNAALAALVSRYDHDLARAIARPVIDALRVPLPEVTNRYLDRYAVLPVLALADPRGTASLIEVIPDLKEEKLGQSRDNARLIVAGALSAPASEFWTIIRRAVSDLELVERED